MVLVTYLAIITEGETWLFQADCANSEDCNVLERWKDIMATHLGFGKTPNINSCPARSVYIYGFKQVSKPNETETETFL